MLYMYNYWANPESATLIREVMDKFHTPSLPTVIAVMRTADLLPGMYSLGNGILSVCPGTDEYVLGTPLLQAR